MGLSQAQIAFLDAEEDTAENREVAEIANERLRSPRSEDRDLDELIDALGFDPAKLDQD